MNSALACDLCDQRSYPREDSGTVVLWSFVAVLVLFALGWRRR